MVDAKDGEIVLSVIEAEKSKGDGTWQVKSVFICQTAGREPKWMEDVRIGE